jgi:hypothetical protein
MSDKIRILLIDDVNDYISYPVLRADQLVLFHIDTWTKAQHMLNTQTESIDPDIILIDINFQEDQSAPRWKQVDGEPDYGDKKPTGLFIGLAFSGMLYKSPLPRVGSIYSADPAMFRGDPSARTAAALLDMTINRPNKLWTQVTVDDWFDSLNLGSDPHHACRAAIIKLREKIIDWCQGSLDARLAVTPSSHWRVEKTLKSIDSLSKIAELRDSLTLDFVTTLNTIRKLNLCSLFADCDISRSIDKATDFLKQISYFPYLLKECISYVEKIEQGARLTVVVPETKALERLVVMILLLLKWWKNRPEEWRKDLNYSWDLENNVPSLKPGISLKAYLKKLATALVDFKKIDFSDLQNTSEYIEPHLFSKGTQYSIFNKKVVSDLLPMLFKAGCLREISKNTWTVVESKIERENKIDFWQAESAGLKFLQQDFLDSLQMQTNQFQRIVQDVNKQSKMNLPIYWENKWKGNGDFQLPCFLRVMFQTYVRENLSWDKENDWPTWLLDKIDKTT